MILFLEAATLSYGQTKGVLTVNVTTQSAASTTSGNMGPSSFGGGHGAGRSYAPNNILAVWIEDNSGKFVKTLLVNAQRYAMYLTSWKTSTSTSGTAYNRVDAVTGATNRYHGTRTCIWDGTDFNGKIVPDGTYRVRMELTEANATGNNSSFTFTKGKSADIQAPADKTNFSAISLKWEPGTSTISKN